VIDHKRSEQQSCFKEIFKGGLDMIIERILTPGISHYSYFIGSGNTAAVIDPRRDVGVYLDLAGRNDLSVTHIFETHRNEDYVVGSTELARQTGAMILHGHRFPFGYGTPIREGEAFPFGPVRLTVLETPGHTFESISLVLTDTAVSEAPLMVFTGDALFAGDTGRTDFYGAARVREVSGTLYDSIHEKILPLGNGVIVAPAHGAGSVCGSYIVDHPVTTIGYEKQVNPVFIMDRESFISKKEAEHHYYPPYFRQMEQFNARGAPVMEKIPVLAPYSPDRLATLGKDVQVLDIRSPTSFAAGHVNGSLSVWRDGIPAFAGWFLDYDRPIILVDDWNLSLDAVVRHLVRIGYDTISGFLAGGFPAWTKAAMPVAETGAWSVQQLRDRLGDPGITVLDVRDIANRRQSGAIEGSVHIYVGELAANLDAIPRGHTIACICDAGYKGSLAASILAGAGFGEVTNVLGGMSAWMKAGYPVVYAIDKK
jgi:hydroxyacylglutathione hydrolase